MLVMLSSYIQHSMNEPDNEKFSIQTTFWVDPAQSNLPGPPASFRTLTTDHSRPQVNRTYTTGCIICEQETYKNVMITSKKTGLLQCAFICSALFVSFLYFKVILCGIYQGVLIHWLDKENYGRQLIGKWLSLFNTVLLINNIKSVCSWSSGTTGI